jgi:WD repeat-containing protein 92
VELVGDFTKPHGIKCGTFGASSIEERHLATGDHAGKLAIYDLDRVDTPVFSQHVLFCLEF